MNTKIIKNNIFNKAKHRKGFVVLFAVVLSSIILAIAFGVSGTSLKELNFSTSAKNTNDAFYAADVGSECFLLNDKTTMNKFPIPGPAQSISCAGNTITPTFSGTTDTASYNFTVSGLGSSGQGCAKVSVLKDQSVNPPATTVISKGYNTGSSSGCTSTSTSLVEREIKLTIGVNATYASTTCDDITATNYGDPLPCTYPSTNNITVTTSAGGTVTSLPSEGNINCGVTCSASLATNSNITLTATPDTGYVFAGWTGNCSGSGQCLLTMDNDKAVGATFELAPTGGIAFVGAVSSMTTSVTLPAHQAGDLLLIFAYRDGSTTAPSLPSGWNSIGSGNGSNANSSILGYRVASGSGTSSGTWLNASGIVAQVYRGVNASDPIGANGSTGGTTNGISYPGLSLQNTNGTSWVAGFIGHRNTNTTIESDLPVGMINRTSAVNGVAEVAGHGTDTGVFSWGTQNFNLTSGTASGWRSRTVEILSQ